MDRKPKQMLESLLQESSCLTDWLNHPFFILVQELCLHHSPRQNLHKALAFPNSQRQCPRIFFSFAGGASACPRRHLRSASSFTYMSRLAGVVSRRPVHNRLGCDTHTSSGQGKNLAMHCVSQNLNSPVMHLGKLSEIGLRTNPLALEFQPGAERLHCSKETVSVAVPSG